jgi:hypothetical protein
MHLRATRSILFVAAFAMAVPIWAAREDWPQ